MDVELIGRWGDYGLAGLIVAVVLALVTWWVRAARADIREEHRQFVGYITQTGERQTEALVASAVATQHSVKALEELARVTNRHDDTAALRHQQLMAEIAAQERAADDRHDELAGQIKALDRDVVVLERGKRTPARRGAREGTA